jgi:hypothetical protein
MTFVGLDLHKRYLTLCALDAAGTVLGELRRLPVALGACVGRSKVEQLMRARSSRVSGRSPSVSMRRPLPASRRWPLSLRFHVRR